MKYIIIVNGKGGCGKDTLISEATEQYAGMVISSIDPIKKIAEQYGYKESDKTNKSRKFLSDLKKVFTEWNDLSLTYITEWVYKLDESFEKLGFIRNIDLLFIQIREPEEIERCKRKINEIVHDIGKDEIFEVHTLLVKRDETDNKSYGNSSDDNVENYNYDFTFINNKSVAESKRDFVTFLEENIFNPSK